MYRCEHFVEKRFSLAIFEKVQHELEELFVYLQNVPYRDYDYAKTECKPVFLSIGFI